jgi:P-type Ca2+ transporter type 2C
MKKPIENPHALDAQTVIDRLSSDSNGLNSDDATNRIANYGPNALPEAEKVSLLKIFIRQFKNLMVLILVPAAIISYAVGQVVDCWIIIFVILADTTFGFFQEYRAEKAITALQKIIVKTAKVLRDGRLQTILSSQVVPGDILVLEEGDRIAADGRIIQSKNFRTIEASLTGESLPISKEIDSLAEGALLADQRNMVWSGTFVAGGYAKIIVTATGASTAIGEISNTLSSIEIRQTNFIKKTNVLAKQMSIIAIISAGTIFLTGYFIRGFALDEIVLTSIAALVAAIPESLPALITVVLAIGARRMSKRNVIVRDFTATETLGEVSVILTDKTGTLTQNSLTVKKVFTSDSKEYSVSGEGWFPVGNFIHDDAIIDVQSSRTLSQLLKIAVISNNSEINHTSEENQYELVGDPTEGALSVLGRKGGLIPEEFIANKSDDLPFSSDTKLRATIVNHDGQYELCVTGAPEELLDRSTNILTSEGEGELTPSEKDQIQQKINDWSNQAMRVIALAYKKQSSESIDENAIDELVFVGIVGMIDPPRPDAKKAVQKCKEAGIRVIMVTGDHVNTAAAIARATGIISEDRSHAVKAINQQQLLKLDDEEFDATVRTVSVFARLTPQMKLRIAGRLQAMGHLIAMTGDGVNDAPALKQADVGISMGIMGTDMARESSDVVLADDNFTTIVNAIEEGRIVFKNSRNTSFFLVTTNIAESVTLLISIMIGLPLPLTATQLLWLNIVTDGVTDMALATEPGHEGIMKEKPVVRKEKIMNRSVLPHIFINVAIMAILTISAFFFFIDESLEKARTAAFIIMSFTQLYNVYNLRSLKTSVFKLGFFSNNYINLGVGISALLLVLITQVPMFASLFRFEPLNMVEYLILFGSSSLVLWIIEIYKLAKNRSVFSS